MKNALIAGAVTLLVIGVIVAIVKLVKTGDEKTPDPTKTEVTGTTLLQTFLGFFGNEDTATTTTTAPVVNGPLNEDAGYTGAFK